MPARAYSTVLSIVSSLMNMARLPASDRWAMASPLARISWSHDGSASACCVDGATVGIFARAISCGLSEALRSSFRQTCVWTQRGMVRPHLRAGVQFLTKQSGMRSGSFRETLRANSRDSDHSSARAVIDTCAPWRSGRGSRGRRSGEGARSSVGGRVGELGHLV